MSRVPEYFQMREIPRTATANERAPWIECCCSSFIDGLYQPAETRLDPFFILYHPIYSASQEGQRAALRRAMDNEVTMFEEVIEYYHNVHAFAFLDATLNPTKVAGATRWALWSNGPSSAADVEEIDAYWYQPGHDKAIVESILFDIEKVTADKRQGRSVLQQSYAVAHGYDVHEKGKYLAEWGLYNAERGGREILVLTVPGCVAFYSEYGYSVTDTIDITPRLDGLGDEASFLERYLFPVKICFMEKTS